MADPRKWKHFERLVAAIHKLADTGADVHWNEIISGRQFDVTIRFKKGLYQYLTVIECKDHTRSVSVGEVDAFVTKSVDANADRGVMASSSGFQSGARQVAEGHNITLIHVSNSEDVNLSFFGAEWGEETETVHIDSIKLEYTTGDKIKLPKEAHALTYYVNHVVLEKGTWRVRLKDLLKNHASNLPHGPHDEYRDHIITLITGVRVVEPDDGEIPLKNLVRIHVRAAPTLAKVVRGPVKFEPYLLMPDVQVHDLTTGEAQTFNPHDLALGIGTAFEEGKFYESPQLASFYYCERIEGELADIYMVKSYQLGTLIQSRVKMKLNFANRYIEVTDNSVLRRLQRRLEKIKGTERPT